MQKVPQFPLVKIIRVLKNYLKHKKFKTFKSTKKNFRYLKSSDFVFICSIVLCLYDHCQVLCCVIVLCYGI